MEAAEAATERCSLKKPAKFLNFKNMKGCISIDTLLCLEGGIGLFLYFFKMMESLQNDSHGNLLFLTEYLRLFYVLQ